MRILQIIQKKQLRGAEMFACQLSNHLLSSGHEVRVVALLDGEATLPFRGPIQIVGAHTGKRFIDYPAWQRLAELIRDFNPDIVQCNAGDTLKYSVLSRLLFRWKAKLVFRNANLISDFLTSSIKHRLNVWFVNRVDFVASVSHLCREDFTKTFNYPTNKIETLPIGIETEISAPKSDLSGVTFGGGKKILLHVGSFVPEKNHAGLLKIFAHLYAGRKDLCLVLIGEGRLKEEIKALAVQSGLENAVYFLGKRNDVLDIMHRSKALLLPSHIEGLPGVILEAFSVRLPVVAYHVGGISEVLNHQTGWLIEKDNVAAFRDAVLEVLDSPEMYISPKTDAAYALASAEYSNAVIARKFLDMYERINK